MGALAGVEREGEVGRWAEVGGRLRMERHWCVDEGWGLWGMGWETREVEGEVKGATRGSGAQEEERGVE